MLTTYTLEIDWHELHEAARALDRARRDRPECLAARPLLGYLGVYDALGGSYFAPTYQSLPGLVRLLAAVDLLARDAWTAVHEARNDQHPIEVARVGARVAIACSRLYRIFHRVGLITDPKERICGTSEGYGLTGLGWLRGDRYDRGVSSAVVESFAAGFPLEPVELAP